MFSFLSNAIMQLHAFVFEILADRQLCWFLLATFYLVGFCFSVISKCLKKED